jgi:hypothetical protein
MFFLRGYFSEDRVGCCANLVGLRRTSPSPPYARAKDIKGRNMLRRMMFRGSTSLLGKLFIGATVPAVVFNIALKFQSVEALARQLLIREEKKMPKPRWGGRKKKEPGDEGRCSASLRRNPERQGIRQLRRRRRSAP